MSLDELTTDVIYRLLAMAKQGMTLDEMAAKTGINRKRIWEHVSPLGKYYTLTYGEPMPEWPKQRWEK